MNSSKDIFKNFCKFVDERIFPMENVGAYIAFVIDQAFIDEFCKIHSLKESDLMYAVRSSLYDIRFFDILHIKGILAIQLFAASKRANDGIITEKNYRDRLSQVLDWPTSELQYWMEDYQERIWNSLYNWCDCHYFQITKCERKTGTGRYVQYPVNQALRVFSEEDLKHIATCFVKRQLSPGEDIQKINFRKLISKYDIIQNAQTNHARLVIANSLSDEDYYDQVYNYFLRWNGDYKEKTHKVQNVIRNNTTQLFMYLPDDFTCIELRTSNLKLEKKFDICSVSYETLSKSYNFKRNRIILFKHDDIYENYWQEVRYLEGKEEEGLVLCFIQNEYELRNRFGSSMLFGNKQIQIYRIKYKFNTAEFYSDKRPYELYGGLKVGRNMYLLGASPTLKLEYPTKIWIDGKSYSDEKKEGDVSLKHLSEGHHYIKIEEFKKIEIDIIQANPSCCNWMETYNQWQIDKNKMLWDSTQNNSGIVGLDYSIIPQKNILSNIPTLKRWSSHLTFGQSLKGETNITLRIIKQVEL